MTSVESLPRLVSGAIKWLQMSSKQIREYLKGSFVHRSYGRKAGPYSPPGVSYISDGRAERKERLRQLREIDRWLGTKPGQRGENQPFTGRRHRIKSP